MSESNNNNSGGFAKTTDFKWFGIGVLIFILIGLILPTPDSMLAKAKDLFGADPSADVNLKATHIQLTIALLATCVVFFATEAVPMPAVALLIGLVQLFFGITAPKTIALTYAHDAVWFESIAMFLFLRGSKSICSRMSSPVYTLFKKVRSGTAITLENLNFLLPLSSLKD